jgi:hypothetical protein
MENGCLHKLGNDYELTKAFSNTNYSETETECFIYHSKGETSGHLTNIYIPLMYLKLGGFFM